MEYLVSLLLSLSNFLGVESIPHSKGVWEINSSWSQPIRGMTQATFSAPVKLLGCQINTSLEFPQIIHGAHQIFIDGQLVESFNDPSMDSARSFFGRPIVNCSRLKGETLTWKVVSNTAYFAHFSEWPKLVSSKHASNVFDESANIAAFGALLVLALYLINGITKNVLVELNITLSVIALCSSIYFFMAVAGLMNTTISMLAAHRIADFSILIATIGVVKYLSLQDLVPKALCYAHYAIVIVAEFIVLFAKSGDEVQVGTTSAFVVLPIALVTAVFSEIKYMYKENKLRVQDFFDLAGLALFGASIIHDSLCVIGVINNQLVLPLGFVGGTYSFATAVHSWTAQIYTERDYLRVNIEHEVERKTNELKVAQAELVQSAKMASLGTLSAGLAHEINNAVNYVNGALAPLEKLVLKNNEVNDKDKIQKLFGVMKDGLQLTVEIIKSLRNYSGLNQATLNDIKIKEVFNSVLAILRNKLRDRITVHLNIPDAATVYGSVVGLNQVFMNIVSNAVDAMPNGGDLTISATEDADKVEIKIKDSGTGIPLDIKNRIFDPFFTTKDVGKGTGLGLYIVKKEIERHAGTVTVTSEENQGTTFIIDLPKQKTERVAA